MYILYSINHVPTDLTVFGITKRDPLSDPFFNSPSPLWKKYLKRCRYTKRKHKTVLKLTIMHSSDDKNVILEWRKYYYNTLDVFNNPKYFCSTIIRKPTPNGKDSVLYGNTRTLGYKWYTNGFNNMFVPANTQPPNYYLGRKLHAMPKKTDECKIRCGIANNRPCIGPSGELYDSLKSAAIQCNVKPLAILKRIQNGVSGWHYADDVSYVPKANKRLGNKYAVGGKCVCKPVIDPFNNVFYSIGEAARYYGVTPKCIKDYVKNGRGWRYK